MRVYNAMVLPTLLYDYETWTQLKRHESKLQALEMRYVQRVEGVTLLDRARNDNVRQALREDALLDVVKAKHKVWRENLEQMVMTGM